MTDAATATDLLERAGHLFPGGVLGSFALPPELAFVPVSGSGTRLQTADGRELVDYVLGGGPMILGHRHPEVEAATEAQIRRGTQFYSYLNEPAIALAAAIVDAVPCAERVRFCTSGSEATMYALRYARAATGRARVVKMEGAYHGNHDATMLSTWPKELGSERGGFDSAGVLDTFREQVSIAAFNDLASVEKVFANHPDAVAAVLVEPYQRFLAPAPGFLAGVRALCDRHGALLVFDEVVTGFRAAYAGMQGVSGITPDLATYGKIIGGGFPLAAVCGRADVLDRSDPAGKGGAEFVYQSGTLNGHPVACAAGLMTLEVLRRPGTYEQTEAIGDRLRRGLRSLLAEHGRPGVVVGDGAAVWNVLFGPTETPTTVREAAAADTGTLKRFHLGLIQRGAFVLPGLRSYVSPMHTEDDVDQTLEMAADTLAALD